MGKISKGARHRAAKGEIQAELITAIFETALDGNDRSAVSKVIRVPHRQAAARRLGRMLGDGIFEERIYRSKNATFLSVKALIGVEVNIEAMREISQAQHSSLVVNQEEVIEAIVQRTRQWLEGHHETTQKRAGHPTVALIDLHVVHGAEFDILVTLLSSRSSDVTDYVRDVIQTTAFVRGTRTMNVAYSRADHRQKNVRQEAVDFTIKRSAPVTPPGNGVGR